MKSLVGGRNGAASLFCCTSDIMSEGPIPDWNRMRAVPNTPAERTTRPLGLRGMNPSGPRAVLLVCTPVIVEPFRATDCTRVEVASLKLDRAVAVFK